MRYYLKSNENMIFLKNKKDILSFNTSAMVLDINFDYTTNRGNKKNKTTRVVYFNNSYYVKFLLSKTNKLISCIEDFFIMFI